jgi:hypothetical protein
MTDRQLQIHKVKAQYAILSSLDVPQNSTSILAKKVNKAMDNLLAKLRILENEEAKNQ